MQKPRTLLLVALMLSLSLAQTSYAAHAFTAKNGKILTDSNFKKLVPLALAFNQCLRAETVEACKRFYAQNDSVISQIDVVMAILPKLPFIVKHFQGEIQWLKPVGRESKVDKEHLYSLLGKTAMKTGQTFFLRYLVVYQQDKLKIYGIDFGEEPINTYWP